MTGTEITNLRKKLDLSQKELAELLGVSKNTIWNYENGGKIPESKLSIIKRALKCNNSTSKNHKINTPDKRIEDLIADRLIEEVKPEIEKLNTELKLQNEKMVKIIALLNSK